MAGAALLAVPAATGEEPLPGPIPAIVLRVVDGDTLEVRARIWVAQDVTVLVRLDGIDTAELRGACAEERAAAVAARAALTELAAGQVVRLHDVRWDKYGGRVLARVTGASGLDVGEALIARAVARPYRGGPRSGWC